MTDSAETNSPGASVSTAAASSVPSAASAAPVATTVDPPKAPAGRPRSRPSMMDRKSSTSFFWALLVTVLACVPPLVIDVDERLAVHPAEQTTLAGAHETWLRWEQGEAGRGLLAFNDGVPMLDKPPLVAWMNIIAWTGLDPAIASPVQLTYRSRLLSVAMGLIAIASIFWMGNSLVDRRMAVLIALVAGSMFVFQQQARLATHDIHALAWMCLSIAGGIWGMAPGQDNRGRRRGFGWVICGLAMACAAMSSNPLAFAMIIIPLLVAIAMAPKARITNLGGLIGAVFIGAAPVALWYWHVETTHGGVRHLLGQEILNPSAPESVFYYVALLGLVLPWTLWMVCGLVHPWQLQPSDEFPGRRRALFGFFWFALVILLFSAFSSKQYSYILPIVPAVALVTAHFVREQERDAIRPEGQKRMDDLTNVHWTALIIASLLVAPFMAMQDWLVANTNGWYPRRLVTPMTWPMAAVLGGTLTILAINGFRWHKEWRAVSAANFTAAWALIATTVFWGRHSEPPNRIHQVKLQAERLAGRIGKAPIRSLRLPEADADGFVLNDEFRFYCARLIDRIKPDELRGFATSSTAPCFVLAPTGPAYDQALLEAGFTQLEPIMTDINQIQQLWQSAPVQE